MIVIKWSITLVQTIKMFMESAVLSLTPGNGKHPGLTTLETHELDLKGLQTQVGAHSRPLETEPSLPAQAVARGTGQGCGKKS